MGAKSEELTQTKVSTPANAISTCGWPLIILIIFARFFPRAIAQNAIMGAARTRQTAS